MDNTYPAVERRKENPEMKALQEQVTNLKTETTELKEEVTNLRKDIAGLVEAWNTAQGVTKFVKWLSTLVVAGVALYAALKGK